MVIDEILINGKTVDSVDNTTVDNIHIKNDIFDSDFHFAKASDEGGLGTVECIDSVDEPIRYLTIFGNTGSNTTNLLDTSNLFNGSYNVAGVKYSSTAWRMTTKYLAVQPNEQYTIAQSGRDNMYFQVQCNCFDKDFKFVKVEGANAIYAYNRTFTIPENTRYVLFSWSVQANGVDIDRGDMWVNKGAEVLPYEPFEPVTAVPTKLTVESENYFTPKNFTTKSRGVTMSWDGEYLTLNGTAESDGIVQRFIGFIDRTKATTGPVRLTSEYISGTFSNSIAFWIGFYTEDNINTQSMAVTLANDYKVSKFSLIGDLVGNLFVNVKTGYTYNNAKWRIRIEQYEPQTVTIPSEYDMSRGNNVAVYTLNNTVKYNSTDITDTEFGQKLLALETYDGYSRVRVDSNVAVPIEINYWKQIKP